MHPPHRGALLPTQSNHLSNNVLCFTSMDTGSVDPREKICEQVEADGGRQDNDTSSVKRRRRASITISRFGEIDPKSKLASSIPPRPNAQSTFYRAQINNRSTHSFASSSAESEGSDELCTEDDHPRVTQLETIPGRRSISTTLESILPRRLTRTRSAQVIRKDSGTKMVIGVSVEREIVESPEQDEAAACSRVHTRHSTHSLSPSLTGSHWTVGGDWFGRRKGKGRSHTFSSAR